MFSEFSVDRLSIIITSISPTVFLPGSRIGNVELLIGKAQSRTTEWAACIQDDTIELKGFDMNPSQGEIEAGLRECRLTPRNERAWRGAHGVSGSTSYMKSFDAVNLPS